MKSIIYFLLILCSTAFGQRADFYREDITFKLDSTFLTVEGYYWFTNHSSQWVNSDIFYPFPYHPVNAIDSIKVFNISSGIETPFIRESESGVSFALRLAPHDTVIFQIGYKQRLSGDSAVYILKTTQGWGKPLELAEYKLMTPLSFNVKTFSYLPDKKYEIGKNRIYYWMKKNFMPVNDMIFYY